MPKKKARSMAAARRRVKPKKTAVRKHVKPKKAAARKAATPQRTKDGGPANWPTMSPYMTVRDASRSLDFYRNAFGFSDTDQVMKDAHGQVMHAGMRLGAAAIMFGPQNPSSEMRPPAESGAVDSLTLYVYVPDVDKLAQRAERAGATVLQRPADQFWGDRIAVFKDPDGYHWTFATNIGSFDASKAAKN